MGADEPNVTRYLAASGYVLSEDPQRLGSRSPHTPSPRLGCSLHLDGNPTQQQGLHLMLCQSCIRETATCRNCPCLGRIWAAGADHYALFEKDCVCLSSLGAQSVGSRVRS